jgi:hypothetical protein
MSSFPFQYLPHSLPIRSEDIDPGMLFGFRDSRVFAVEEGGVEIFGQVCGIGEVVKRQ